MRKINAIQLMTSIGQFSKKNQGIFGLKKLGLCIFFFSIFLNCKTREQQRINSIGHQDSSNRSIFYFSQVDFMYRYNCAVHNKLSAAYFKSHCEELNKMDLDVFYKKLAKTWTDEGEDDDEAMTIVNNHKRFFADVNPHEVTDLDYEDLQERLEKVFSPSPPSEKGGTLVLGQIPKRPAIDPMVKQVVVWNLKDYPGTNMPLSTDEVLQAMNDLKQEYWGHPVNEKLRQDCLNNLVPEWSDLMFHYYCQIGAARKCFTLQAKDQGRTLGGYTTSYEICKDDHDFKWLSRNQADIFRYIMFTVGDPEAFNQADQDEVINEFYGVTSAANCKLRPRRNAPPNPEFPCGRKIGRIDLKEQAKWDSAGGSSTTTSKDPMKQKPTDKSTQSNGEGSKPQSEHTSTQETSEAGLSDMPQVAPQVGIKALGAYWYLTASGTGNCSSLCASKGGLMSDLLKSTIKPEVCQKLSERMFEGNTKLAPYLRGTGACEAGCMVNPKKKQFFGCNESKPEVNFITLGWERLCPCVH
jgi:hypothetical protein